METIVVGPLGVNCFILADADSKEGVVVDPGEDAGVILAKVKELGLTIKYVINTHGHFDHVGANSAVIEATGAPLLIHEMDAVLLGKASRSAANYGLRVQDSPAPAGFLTDGQKIEFGKYTIEVRHTPGHTQGGCSLYLADQNLVITGDTLFLYSVGRTDLPGGSHATLIASIREKLLTLPDETVVWPGHGPSSTIGAERTGNPYLT
ncbi:MBL fold metallo-hydrolase [Geomesophilobacter sediminis]|nr:MBL fold metallo-hydrolase [Geomesophilobacter sediminis]